jgi:hypothetical protein
MRLALIGPISCLDDFCSQCDMHLVLAHKVLEDEKYCEFYRKMRARGDHIIMDNAAFELGSAIPMDKLLKAAEMVNAQEVVLPDVYLNGKATLRRVKEAIRDLYKRDLIGKYILQAVPHGDSIRGYKKCFNIISSMKEIKVIGLSFGGIYNACKEEWGYRSDVHCTQYRAELLEKEIELRKDKEYHALGILDNPIEIKSLAYLGFIRSNDTSSPIWHGIHGIAFDEERGHSPKLKTKVDFNASLNGKGNIIQNNIDICKGWSKV